MLPEWRKKRTERRGRSDSKRKPKAGHSRVQNNE
jgi:hypothetical protein